VPRASSGVEDEFARSFRRQHVARFWIDDFKDAQVGIEMITARRLVEAAWAFGEGCFAFGKSVSRNDIDVASAQFMGQRNQFAAHPVGNFFTAHNNSLQRFTAHILFRGLVQHVIHERRHPDDHVRLKLCG